MWAWVVAAQGEPITNTDADTLISIIVAVGMILAVGLTVLAVEHFRPRRTPPPPPSAMLVNLVTGEQFSLGADAQTVVYIGRAADCDICIDDPMVEPCHVAVRYGQGKYFLQAHTEQARILLNGRAVRAARLVNGDRVTVGAATLQFRQGQ